MIVKPKLGEFEQEPGYTTSGMMLLMRATRLGHSQEVDANTHLPAVFHLMRKLADS